jgi:hypothetical protein
VFQTADKKCVVESFKVLLGTDGVNKAKYRVAQILVHSTSTTFASGQNHSILLKFLNMALFPGVLVLANNDCGFISVKEQKWVDYIQVLKNELFGSKVEHYVVGFRYHHVHCFALLLGQKTRPVT